MKFLQIIVPVGPEGPRKPYLHVVLKKEIFRNSRLISIRLGTNYPWVKEILICSNKGPILLQSGDNRKLQTWNGVI
jgi:hypothetical protein